MGTTRSQHRYTEWAKLRELRLNAGFTITTLAAAAEMSLPHLSQVEKGQRGLSDGTLVKLAQTLRVAPAVLDRSRPPVPSRRRSPVRTAA